jgi:8-oxo-dGTP pyrophosphatase MutT (NUDIX family)
MGREAVPTWFFSLVVVRRGDEFLVVHERKHGQLWYLPAGRAEPGESLAEAALRETREETGVPIVLEGVLRVEHTPLPDGARVRAIFVARPADDTPPKSAPDGESLGAAWVTLEALAKLPLRGHEVRELFAHVAGGAPVYPLDVLTLEGAPL